jgi:spermidine synthase
VANLFDVIVVDVFRGRVVPPFVISETFLTACKHRLSGNGILIVNYMLDNPIEWEQFLSRLAGLFPSVQVLTIGINKILIAKGGRIVS